MSPKYTGQSPGQPLCVSVTVFRSLMADLGHPAAHALIEVLPEQVSLGQRCAGFVSASRTKSGKYSSVGGGSLRIWGASGSCGHRAGTTWTGGVADRKSTRLNSSH